MFLFSFLSRENRDKVRENYFHESLTELQRVQCLLQFSHKVRFYIALSTEGKKIQLAQWNIFIQREVNNLPKLPREDQPRVYSCTRFRGSKASTGQNCDLMDAKNPYALLKRTSTFLPGNTEYGKRNSHHPLPTHWEYLIVQVPGLVVIFVTPSAEERLVVHLDQLPFRTETEVPENSEHGREKRKSQSQPDICFH